ncbi:kinase-like domain-containing protein [Aspergillus bertholletiae]|uniref:Kinase-like domain-containing protein n=1 Tax=Aspergillus bertholletiae TaxID=1226010 RepID=A0A5N7AMJ7_9EURO|nr:kinase-like domain-containing protein [Aspergillus bertholletiae]
MIFLRIQTPGPVTAVSSRHHLSTSPPAFREGFFRNTFNEIDQLQRIAGEAVQQDYCPDITKFAEGGFNRVFLLRANNGREVIARIPTSTAGPPHYTTASEMATMNFLRAVLKLPVPEVLAYSTSSDIPVGAAYILMKRVKGESLSSRRLSLTTDEVKDIMTQIADIERKILDFHLPAYGSLYHQKDLDGETQVPIVEDFCIGPVSARQFWHGERSKMEIDRGPWLSPEDYVTSAARREMAVIQHHAKAQPRQTFHLPTSHDILPSEHTSLLSVPTLRHPDLSPSNITLAPGSTKIIGIIDWQDAVIFPRFMQAGYPAFCEHDSSQSQSMRIPSLLHDFDETGVDEQRQCRAIFRLGEANLYYTAATGVHNDKHMDSLRLPYLGMRQYLLRQIKYPWDADVINLTGTSSTTCPVAFSDEEPETAMAESQEWNESEQLLSRVREYLDIDLEGGTELDNFERAVEGNRQFRMEMVRQAEMDQREICWRN